MTYLEAIRAEVKPYEVGLSTVKWQCQKYGVFDEDEVEDIPAVAFISIKILSQMLMLNNISEGGVSQSYNKESVEKHISMLCDEIGLDSSNYIVKPTVTYLGDI